MYAQKVYRGFESLSLRHPVCFLRLIRRRTHFILRNRSELMAYLVLARKWRPQTFEEVIGQPHVTTTLRNAVISGRIAHAYLFTGARGVGKTSVARILAKTLNCAKGDPAQPCNECSNCREITHGNAVDVLEVDGASNRGIDSIRELRETVRYRPTKGRYRVYIIDEVHMLTPEAFNALLKTLEEPPEHVIFIFATTEPHKIPATILSRCQRFDFRRISTSILIRQLKDIVSQEGVVFSEAVLYTIAKEADGSMRDAQSLLEQLLAFSGDGLADSEILDILGVVDRSCVHKVAQAVLGGDVRTCLDEIEDIYRRGIDNKRFCRQLCEHFRNLLFLSMESGGEGERISWLDLPDEEREALRKQAMETTPESLHLYFQLIMRGEEEIRRSSLPRVSLEMLLLKLARLPRIESLDRLLARLSNLENRYPEGFRGSLPDRRTAHPGKMGGEERKTTAVRPPLSHGAPPPPEASSPAPPPPAAAPMERDARPLGEGEFAHSPLSRDEEDFKGGRAAEPKEIEERWPVFIRHVQGKEYVLAALLGGSRASLLADDDGAVRLEVLEMYDEAMKKPETLALLRREAEDYFGAVFQFHVETRSSAQADSTHQHKKTGTPKSNLKRQVMEHPLVQAAIEVLGGELIDIRTPRDASAKED